MMTCPSTTSSSKKPPLPDDDYRAAATRHRVATLTLPAHWHAVDFISDLHLSPALPKTLSAWAGHMASTDADAVFLLGDVFEVWIGDDALDRSFEAQCADVLAHAARDHCIFLLHGNRDFLLGDRFFDATGVQPLEDPVCLEFNGHRLLASHGDELCLDDVPYQQFRKMVRSLAWQAQFLSQPMEARLQMAGQARAASQSSQAARDPVTFADADPELARQWLEVAGADVLVHGHTHRPATERREGGWQRWVLSDWDLDDPLHPRAEVLRWTSAGTLTRLPIAEAAPSGPAED